MNWFFMAFLLMTVTVYIYAMLWEKVDDLRQERDQQGIGASQLHEKAALIGLALFIAFLFTIFLEIVREM